LHFGVRDEWIIIFWNWYWLSVDIIMSFGDGLTGFVFIRPVLRVGIDAIIFGFVRMNLIWESLDHITMHTTLCVGLLDGGGSAVIHVDTKFQLA
jgi:hypothetical protein